MDIGQVTTNKTKISFLPSTECIKRLYTRLVYRFHIIKTQTLFREYYMNTIWMFFLLSFSLLNRLPLQPLVLVLGASNNFRFSFFVSIFVSVICVCVCVRLCFYSYFFILSCLIETSSERTLVCTAPGPSQIVLFVLTWRFVSFGRLLCVVATVSSFRFTNFVHLYTHYGMAGARLCVSV